MGPNYSAFDHIRSHITTLFNNPAMYNFLLTKSNRYIRYRFVLFSQEVFRSCTYITVHTSVIDIEIAIVKEKNNKYR